MRVRRLVKHVACVTVAAAVAMTAAACGGSSGATSAVEGSWDEVVAAAEEEGSVLLYSSQNSVILENVKKAWSKKYPGITMEFVRGTDADLNPRIETENRTGRGAADVHVVTDTSWITSAGESGDFSQAVRGPAFDNPDYERDTSVRAGDFFLTVAATFGMGWNTNAVPAGLTTPLDVLKPEYRGRIGIVNPNGIASFVDLYDFYGEHFGSDFEEKLAGLEPRIFPSAIGVAQALTSGEVVVSPMVQPLVQEAATGAPVDWALPDPSWGTPFFGHITAVAPHPNAAQLLADFLVSPEGQAAQAIGVATALPGISGSTADAKDIRSPDPGQLTPDYVKQRSQAWQKMFTG